MLNILYCCWCCTIPNGTKQARILIAIDVTKCTSVYKMTSLPEILDSILFLQTHLKIELNQRVVNCWQPFQRFLKPFLNGFPAICRRFMYLKKASNQNLVMQLSLTAVDGQFLLSYAFASIKISCVDFLGSCDSTKYTTQSHGLPLNIFVGEEVFSLCQIIFYSRFI